MSIEIPHAQGPEKSVLSSMLKDPVYIAKAKSGGLSADHFHLPGHVALFRTIIERDAKGLACELVALVDALHKGGLLDSIGGPAAITDIFTYAPNGAHFDGHVALLRENHALRIGKLASYEISQLPADTTAEEIATRLRYTLEATTKALAHDSGLISAEKAAIALDAKLAELCSNQRAPGLETGLSPIDIVTGGMRPGEFWVVAAEPSGGKSVVMLQAAASALSEGKRVLVISLEMDAATVLSRILTNMHSIPFHTFTDPRRAGRGYLERARIALKSAVSLPLTIHDEGGVSLEQITGMAVVESDLKGGLDLLVVDYLQLIEGSQRRNSNRQEEVAAISRGLKALAKRLKCPVFSASQLNDDGRLRESRAIGQDADVVLKIKEDGIKGIKVRNGQKDQLFPLFLNGEFQRFDQQN